MERTAEYADRITWLEETIRIKKLELRDAGIRGDHMAVTILSDEIATLQEQLSVAWLDKEMEEQR